MGGDGARDLAPPPEISFLMAQGVPASQLMLATRRAQDWGVGAEAALIGLGILDEEAFYRALAAHLGVPYARRDPRPLPGTRLGDAVATGILRVEGAGPGRRYALAPAGMGLRRLIERPGRVLPSVVIVTPTRLRTMARGADAGGVAHRASHDLADAEPDFSIRDAPPPAAIVLAMAALPCAALAAGLAPAAVGAAIMALASLPFLTLVLLRLAAAAEPFRPNLPLAFAFGLRDRDLPRYTVLVPLYREAAILPQTLRAMRSLNYPPARLEVKFLVEADDAETQQAFAALELPPQAEIVVVPDGQPRTKPRALNAALEEATGQLVVVYDAEDVPDPLQLRFAAALFHTLPADVACLQGRLVIDNTEDSWLTRMFTVEYAQLFDVLNPFLAQHRLPVPLGGTSTHFRMEALRRAGGWDAWNVTEDADLGLRLSTLGYRTADLPSATVEEAPSTLGRWLGQRTRWFKGWAQVAITFWRAPRRRIAGMGVTRWLAGHMLILGTLASAAGFPLFTLVAIANLVGTFQTPPSSWLGSSVAGYFAVLFGSGFAAMVVPAWTAMRRRRLSIPLRHLALLPVYYLLMSWAAWRGLFELAHAPTRWNKTEHGLARSSRTGALTIRPEGPSPPPPADA